jgi:hypothetical protein
VEQSDKAIHSFFGDIDGLLRGACHRARIRATRWLAMTEEPACAQGTREIRMARGIAKIAAMHNCS